MKYLAILIFFLFVIAISSAVVLASSSDFWVRCLSSCSNSLCTNPSGGGTCCSAGQHLGANYYCCNVAGYYGWYSPSCPPVTSSVIIYLGTSPSNGGTLCANIYCTSGSSFPVRFNVGDSVQLKATPNSGYAFDHFGNDGAGVPPIRPGDTVGGHYCYCSGSSCYFTFDVTANPGNLYAYFKCAPQCSGKNCGPDGCGGSCGTCTRPLETCSGAGKCTSCTGGVFSDTSSSCTDEEYWSSYHWSSPDCFYDDSYDRTRCSNECNSLYPGTIGILDNSAAGYGYCWYACMEGSNEYCWDCVCVDEKEGDVCGATTCPSSGCCGTDYVQYAPSCTKTCQSGICPSCGSGSCLPTVTACAPLCHCDNGAQDCGECAVDKGGGCPEPCLKSNGELCSDNSECQSGFCVDGVCCNSACSGTCQRCDSYDGTAGTCHNIAETHDPNNECSDVWSCDAINCQRRMLPGTCDGDSAACENEDYTYQDCGSFTCSGGSCTSTCSQSCGAQCDSNDDCASNNCNLATCTCGSPICTRSNPTVTVTPSSQTGEPSQTRTYTINVRNNDNSACSASTFTLSNNCPSGWTCSRNRNSVIVSPQTTNSTATISVTPPSSVGTGSYSFTVTATSSSYTGAGSASYTVSCECLSGSCCSDGCHFNPAGTSCRPVAGSCDVAEYCTGTGASCPSDSYLPSSTVCRASAGTCDLTEYCTGSSASCPFDSLRSSSDVCRASTGTCDPTEYCTGSSINCPSNSFRPAGYDCGSCRECNGLGSCNYLCSGLESSCECIGNVCIRCSSYYGTDCGDEDTSCLETQKPSWTCSAGSCSYSCINDLGCPDSSCILSSARITANCAGGSSPYCEPGEAIAMTGTYTGSGCSAADFFQIDAISSDGLCNIQFVGGDMIGINDSTISLAGGTVSGSWTVPSIGYDCSGKTITPTGAAVYDGGEPNVGDQLDYTGSVFGSARFVVVDVPVTVTTSPTTGSGFIVVDGSPTTTSSSFSWTPDTPHTLSANSPVPCGTGCQDVFVSWSDGGSQTHNVIAPSTPTTYTANYQRQYYLTMSTSGDGSATPNSGWRNSGSNPTIEAFPNPGGYEFVTWSGTGSGSYSGTNNPYSSLVINNPVTETAIFAFDECDVSSECDDTNICTSDWCEDPSAPDSVCHRDPAGPGTSCGTSPCPADECVGSTLNDYEGACTLYCSGSTCPSECTCIATPVDCSQIGTDVDGDGIYCSCECGFYDIEENYATGDTCSDGLDNDCDGKIDGEEAECPDNSMSFSGDLMYSTGNPVANSRIEARIDDGLGFKKSSDSETDSDGHFVVKLLNLPTSLMSSEFDLAFYVEGEVDAIYECHYYTSGANQGKCV